LFRIDRRYVNLGSTKFNRLSAGGKQEVDAEGEFPEAATSAEAMEELVRKQIHDEYLSEAETEANAKAKEILARARIEAAQIILEARDLKEEERKRGWEEGYTEGSAQGKHSYDEQLDAKIREDDEALKHVLGELHEERQRTYEELENEITSLALEIVRKVINPAEDEIGGVFTSLIKNALRQMSTDRKIVIRVAPAEYERFFSSGAASIELDSGETVTASVLRDVSLEDGDCIIDTDEITVNAGIESQLQFVKLAFERANQYEPDRIE